MPQFVPERKPKSGTGKRRRRGVPLKKAIRALRPMTSAAASGGRVPHTSLDSQAGEPEAVTATSGSPSGDCGYWSLDFGQLLQGANVRRKSGSSMNPFHSETSSRLIFV